MNTVGIRRWGEGKLKALKANAVLPGKTLTQLTGIEVGNYLISLS